MERAKIDRINELAKKAKQQDLTPEELAERDALRKEYIKAHRENLIAQLEKVRVVDENGNKVKLKKKDN